MKTLLKKLINFLQNTFAVKSLVKSNVLKVLIRQLKESFPIDFLVAKKIDVFIEVVLLHECDDVIHTGLGRDGDRCIETV